MQTESVNLQALIDNMLEYADEHWQEYVKHGQCVFIHGIREAEKAYKRLYGEEMPHSVFFGLIDNPKIDRAADWMEAIVRDRLRDHLQMAPPIDWSHPTMAELLRERGMSMKDFI